MQETVLSMTNISKAYKKKPVLSDIHMTIPRGAIYGLAGSNGAGKSTLMRIISGQTAADKGELNLFGTIPVRNNTQIRHRMGILIEEPGFFHHMTAAENLEYYRLQFGVPGEERISEVLDLVGLSQTGKKKFGDFSMGMKQRLGLALALLHSPEFLVLDEPINGLDPESIREMRRVFLDLNKRQNVTLLISSHILAELENIATVYGFLSHGKLLQEITAEELKKKCSTYIDLQVTDSKQMCVVLEKDLGLTDYQVHPDGHIHIFHAMERGEEIARAAVMKGIGLKSLSSHALNLENYYMNLMGGDTNV
ncbi:ATP-binding cassette domain-containing protein [Blautia schinkii]|nr:ATP-binding cassette domain-containing protein [Blautia schinkii]